MIELRGTSHVASHDISQIRELIRDRQPAVVAIELDPRRLDVLLHGRSRRARSPLIMLLQLLQTVIGRRTGVMPGSDMLAAFETATQHNIDVALIDRDISITIQHLQQRLPLREKIKFIGFLLVGAFVLPRHHIDLRDVPDDAIVNEALLRLETSFPTLHKILVAERNQVMASRLTALDAEYGDVLAFLGAGHVSGVQHLLDDTTQSS